MVRAYQSCVKIKAACKWDEIKESRIIYARFQSMHDCTARSACLPPLSTHPCAADEAIDRFLSHLVPPSMNVYFSSQAHAPGSTPLKEEWYGAQYGVQPLSQVS